MFNLNIMRGAVQPSTVSSIREGKNTPSELGFSSGFLRWNTRLKLQFCLFWVFFIYFDLKSMIGSHVSNWWPAGHSSLLSAPVWSHAILRSLITIATHYTSHDYEQTERGSPWTWCLHCPRKKKLDQVYSKLDTHLEILVLDPNKYINYFLLLLQNSFTNQKSDFFFFF